MRGIGMTGAQALLAWQGLGGAAGEQGAAR
jgi:hypothetical protein